MRTTILLIFGVISFTSSAQDYGYFGKKNTLSLNAIVYNPLIYNLFNRAYESYKKSASGVTPGKSQIDYGYSAAYSHYFSGSFGLGAEVSMVYGKIISPTYYDFSKYSNYGNYGGYGSYEDYISSSANLRVEQFQISTLTIMPKIEFNMSGGQLPIGINHQFGVGVSTTKLVEKNYQIKLVSFSSSDSSPFNKSLITPYAELGKFRNLTLMYAFNVRTPISKSFMINYGLKYNLNVSIANVKNELGVSNEYMQNQVVGAINEEIRQKRSNSILSFNIGLSFIF